MRLRGRFCGYAPATAAPHAALDAAILSPQQRGTIATSEQTGI